MIKLAFGAVSGEIRDSVYQLFAVEFTQNEVQPVGAPASGHRARPAYQYTFLSVKVLQESGGQPTGKPLGGM